MFNILKIKDMNLKEIKNHSNYSVSDTGIVINNKKNTILKPHTNTTGYQQVCIKSDDGEMDHILISVLVAEHFISEKPMGMVVDHIDGNKLNNRVENLRYITQKENCNTSYHKRNLSNTLKRKTKQPTRGEYERGVVVLKYGKFIAQYKSVSECANNLGIDRGGIANVLSGSVKTYKGYEFVYYSDYRPKNKNKLF